MPLLVLLVGEREQTRIVGEAEVAAAPAVVDKTEAAGGGLT